jgi:hypothetical protein
MTTFNTSLLDFIDLNPVNIGASVLKKTNTSEYNGITPNFNYNNVSIENELYDLLNLPGLYPYGVYYAGDYGIYGDGILPDRTNNNNHAIVSGNYPIVYDSDGSNGDINQFKVLIGDSLTTILFPDNSIAGDFTICSITRYNSGTKNSILTSIDGKLIQGHYNGSSGYIKYNNNVINSGINLNNNFVISCGKNGSITTNSIIVNNYPVGNSLNINPITNSTLSINGSDGNQGDFAFVYLMIWHDKLSDVHLQQISSAFMKFVYNTNINYIYPLYKSGVNLNLDLSGVIDLVSSNIVIPTINSNTILDVIKNNNDLINLGLFVNQKYTSTNPNKISSLEYYYQFNSIYSNSIKLLQATPCDILIVGSGGNGGSNIYSGGGGSGEIIYTSNYILQPDLYNIVVGNSGSYSAILNSSGYTIMKAMGGGNGGYNKYITFNFINSDNFVTVGSTNYTNYTNFPSSLGTILISNGTTTINGYIIPAGYQIWTVGTTGSYNILAAGSAGGRYNNNYGGSGVVISTTYNFTAGQYVIMLIGQKSSSSSSGGGATFISIYSATGNFNLANQHNIILIAGGGGGAGNGNGGLNAVSNTSGTLNYNNNGTIAINGGGGSCSGGTGGNGIDGSGGSPYSQGGGGGFIGNGGNGGFSFINNGTGGLINNGMGTGLGLVGGFGGGGSGYNGGGGGGGGYSGGEASSNSGGGGGGSYDINGSGYNATLYTTWNTVTYGSMPNTYSFGFNNANGYIILNTIILPPVNPTIGGSGGGGFGGFVSSQNGANGGNYWSSNNCYGITSNGNNGTLIKGGDGGNINFISDITSNIILYGKGGSGATSSSVPVIKTNNTGNGGDGNGGIGASGVVILKLYINDNTLVASNVLMIADMIQGSLNITSNIVKNVSIVTSNLIAYNYNITSNNIYNLSVNVSNLINSNFIITSNMLNILSSNTSNLEFYNFNKTSNIIVNLSSNMSNLVNSNLITLSYNINTLSSNVSNLIFNTSNIPAVMINKLSVNVSNLINSNFIITSNMINNLSSNMSNLVNSNYLLNINSIYNTSNYIYNNFISTTNYGINTSNYINNNLIQTNNIITNILNANSNIVGNILNISNMIFNLSSNTSNYELNNFNIINSMITNLSTNTSNYEFNNFNSNLNVVINTSNYELNNFNIINSMINNLSINTSNYEFNNFNTIINSIFSLSDNSSNLFYTTSNINSNLLYTLSGYTSNISISNFVYTSNMIIDLSNNVSNLISSNFIITSNLIINYTNTINANISANIPVVLSSNDIIDISNNYNSLNSLFSYTTNSNYYKINNNSYYFMFSNIGSSNYFRLLQPVYCRLLIVGGGGNGGNGSYSGGGGAGEIIYTSNILLNTGFYSITVGTSNLYSAMYYNNGSLLARAAGGGNGGYVGKNPTSGGSGGGGAGSTIQSGSLIGSVWNSNTLLGLSYAGNNGTATQGGNGGSADFSMTITSNNFIYGVGGIGATSSSVPSIKPSNSGYGGDGNGGLGSAGVVIIMLNILNINSNIIINTSNLYNSALSVTSNIYNNSLIITSNLYTNLRNYTTNLVNNVPLLNTVIISPSGTGTISSRTLTINLPTSYSTLTATNLTATTINVPSIVNSGSISINNSTTGNIIIFQSASKNISYIDNIGNYTIIPYINNYVSTSTTYNSFDTLTGYYLFTTGTNTIQFLQNTICDILVVGNGGNGIIGSYIGGGGGGEIIYANNIKLTPNTYTINVNSSYSSIINNTLTLALAKCGGTGGGSSTLIFNFNILDGSGTNSPSGSLNYSTIPSTIGTLTISNGTTNINGYTIPKGYQIWKVGITGTYKLLAAGSSGGQLIYGGAGSPGAGVVISTTVNLTANQYVIIAIGQKPIYNGGGAGGGGGGTFITIYSATGNFNLASQHTILLIAGGGAGSSFISSGGAATTNTYTSSASNGGGGGAGGLYDTAGASGGNATDGGDNSNNMNGMGSAGGGAGFIGNGGKNTYDSGGERSYSFLNGCLGGISPTQNYYNGGFGGGGYQQGYGTGADGTMGGGGGYSGGSCLYYKQGEGGASYDINGTNKNATLYSSWNTSDFGTQLSSYSGGYNWSDGFVIINGTITPPNPTSGGSGGGGNANPTIFFNFNKLNGIGAWSPTSATNYSIIPSIIGTITISNGSTTINGYTIPYGYQIWKVGTTGTYNLLSAGAAGYKDNNWNGDSGKISGNGVVISTTVNLTENQYVIISVGQIPATFNNGTQRYGAGGGGGTFITIYAATGNFNLASQHTILLIAGGGSSASYNYNGLNATILSYTSSSTNGGGGGGGGISGGNGTDGGSYTGTTTYAEGGNGGAGFIGNGGSGNPNIDNNWITRSRSFLNGCAAGASLNQSPLYGVYGGYGGGGIVGNNSPGNVYGCGGGGGYCGGNATYTNTAEGGASYDINGTNKNATLYSTWNTSIFSDQPSSFNSGYNTSDGFVCISITKPPSSYMYGATAGTTWNGNGFIGTTYSGGNGTSTQGGNGGGPGFLCTITGNSVTYGLGGSGATSSSTPTTKTNNTGCGGDGNGGTGASGCVVIKTYMNYDGFITSNICKSIANNTTTASLSTSIWNVNNNYYCDYVGGTSLNLTSNNYICFNSNTSSNVITGLQGSYSFTYDKGTAILTNNNVMYQNINNSNSITTLPIVWYRFDDIYNLTKDYGSLGLNLTKVGNGGTYNSLIYKRGTGSVKFNNDANYFISPSINVNVPLTFSFWFLSPTGNTAYQSLLSYGNVGIVFELYYGGGPNNNTGFSVLINANTSWSIIMRNATNVVPYDKWCHVVLTVTNTNPINATLYFDGVLISSANGTYSAIGNATYLAIGYRQDSAYYSGAYIDDVRIYDYVLPYNEILKLYYNTTYFDNSYPNIYDSCNVILKPLAWYKFDNNIINDSSGNNNTLTAYNNPTLTNGIKGINSLYLNGSQYLNGTTNFNLTNSSFSVSFWVSPYSYSTSPVYFTIGSTQSTRQLVHLYSPANSIIFSSVGDVATTQNSFNDLYKWIHLVITFDNSSYIKYIYRNGQQLNLDSGLLAGGSHTLTNNIGFGVWVNLSANLFNGTIDDFRIYNTCLTQNQIDELYTGRITIGNLQSINTNNNVGIGTTNPNTALHINGNIYSPNFSCQQICKLDKFGWNNYKTNIFFCGNGTKYFNAIFALYSSTNFISVNFNFYTSNGKYVTTETHTCCTSVLSNHAVYNWQFIMTNTILPGGYYYIYITTSNAGIDSNDYLNIVLINYPF